MFVKNGTKKSVVITFLRNPFLTLLLTFQSNITNAVLSYETSHRVSVQREIKLLCLHEIGWCRLIQLDFGKATEHFKELKYVLLMYALCYCVCKIILYKTQQYTKENLIRIFSTSYIGRSSSFCLSFDIFHLVSFLLFVIPAMFMIIVWFYFSFYD